MVQLRACTIRTMTPTIECQCTCGGNSVCQQSTQKLQGPDVKKTVCLEVELKLNVPSSCEENQSNGCAGKRELAGAKGTQAFAGCG